MSLKLPKPKKPSMPSMPGFTLFGGNKFNPKAGPPRKAHSLSNLNLDASKRQEEFGVNYGPIKLNLGGNEISFEGGEWISETGGGGVNQRDVIKLKKENQELREENNLLKIKIELLLDMVSERTAELHLQENQIKQLDKLVKGR